MIHKNHQLWSSSTPKIREELQKNTAKKIMKLASFYTTSNFRFTEKNSHNKHPFNPIELLTLLHSCTRGPTPSQSNKKEYVSLCEEVCRSGFTGACTGATVTAACRLPLPVCVLHQAATWGGEEVGWAWCIMTLPDRFAVFLGSLLESFLELCSFAELLLEEYF